MIKRLNLYIQFWSNLLLHVIPDDIDKINHQTSNISRSLVDNKPIDHSDVVGVLPVDAAIATSSFPT